MDITTETTQVADINRGLDDDRTWELIDRILLDCLSEEVARQHIDDRRNLELTALNIKKQLPQQDKSYQNEILSQWSVSIAETIGTDIVSPRLAKTQRTLPTQSVAQISYNQAVLCLSCFIANELDAFLCDEPDNATRIFELTDELPFSPDTSSQLQAA